MSRVQKLLNKGPVDADLGSASKMQHDQMQSAGKRQNYLKRMIELHQSKPSSVTTACTYAPNEMSATKSVSYLRNSHSSGHKRTKKSGTETAFTAMSSIVTPHPQNDKQKKDKKQAVQNSHLGKRQSQTPIGKQFPLVS